MSSDIEARCPYQSGARPSRPGFPKSTSFHRHFNASIPIGLLPSTCWICCNNGQLSELLTRQVISRDECHLVTVRKPSISSIFAHVPIHQVADRFAPFATCATYALSRQPPAGELLVQQGFAVEAYDEAKYSRACTGPPADVVSTWPVA